MADIRCPMCGKLNPQDMAVCAHCGARVKPLQMGSEPPPAQSPAANGADWMNDLRGDIMKNRPKTGLLPPEPEASSDTGNWLSRIDGEDAESPPQTSAATPPAPQAPPKPVSSRLSTLHERVQSAPEPPAQPLERASAASPGDVPAWLSKVRTQVTASAARSEPAKTPPPAQAPANLPSQKREEEPPWLKRIRTRHVQEGISSAPESELNPEPTIEPESTDALPEWLSKIHDSETDSGAAADNAFLSSALPPTPYGSDTEIAGIGMEPPSAAIGAQSASLDSFAGEADLPDWLHPMTSDAKPGGAGETPFSGELPEWLPSPDPKGFGEPLAASPFEDVALGSPTVPGKVPSPAMPSWELPTESADVPFDTGLTFPPTSSAFTDGMEPMVSPTGAEEIPDWLASAKEESTAAPAHVLPEDEEPGIPTPDIEQLLGPDSIPAWMNKPKKETEPEPEVVAPIEVPAGDGLEAGDLPQWLEAMRPVQSVRMEDDERVESVGPLAGLRGVISAEPVVAMPRRPQVLVGNIDATPAQVAKADLLQRLIIEPEIRQARKVIRNAWVTPLSRRLIATALLLAALLPNFGWGLFSNPIYIPPVTRNAGSVVESLAPEKPVLIAFDYDPSAAPELEPGARSVLLHLARRGISVAAISTEPAGTTLAQSLLADPAYSSSLPAVRYNFGFIPGGASGMRSLATNFRRATAVPILQWTREELAGIDSIDDFSMILVISARPQTVRDWIEQVHTRLPGIPMVAVISASADALVFPYTQGYYPSLAGLISGYAGAEAYAAQYPGTSPADPAGAARWQAFGMTNCASLSILLAGMIVSLSVLILRKPKGRKG